MSVHEDRHSQAGLQARAAWPRETRPKGIMGSCDMALKNESGSAMGTAPDDFAFVVDDILTDRREAQLRIRGHGSAH